MNVAEKARRLLSDQKDTKSAISELLISRLTSTLPCGGRPDATAGVADSPRDEDDLVAACKSEADRSKRREAKLARKAQREVYS